MSWRCPCQYLLFDSDEWLVGTAFLFLPYYTFAAWCHVVLGVSCPRLLRHDKMSQVQPCVSKRGLGIRVILQLVVWRLVSRICSMPRQLSLLQCEPRHHLQYARADPVFYRSCHHAQFRFCLGSWMHADENISIPIWGSLSCIGPWLGEIYVGCWLESSCRWCRTP